MLNEREVKILEMLLKGEDLTIDEVSEHFSVSKRSIQYDVNKINYYLLKNQNPKILIKDSRFMFDVDAITNILKDNDKSNDLIKDDRIDLIYLNSIFSLTGLNISSLSKIIGVSRNTIKSDMETMNEKFEYDNSKGYYIKKNNIKKIEILERIYRNGRINKYIDEVLDKDLISNIKEFIKETSNNIKLNISEDIYLKLLISIYCHYVFYEKNTVNSNLIAGNDYFIIENIFNKYFSNKRSFNTIADILIGLSINSNLESWLDESFLIKKLIKYVSDNLNIDLTEDTILYDFLLSHLKVSIYRLKKNIKLSNTFYEKLDWDDENLIKILKKGLVEIESTFEIKFTDIELSLIMYHFKASIDRTEINNRKKVILVCGLGYGTSRVLEYYLKDHFDIDIIDVLPAYMINRDISKNMNIDYILTTVDLDFEAIKINPVLQIEDYKKLESLGIKRKKDKIVIDNFIKDLQEIGKFDEKILKNLLNQKYSNIFVDKLKMKNNLSGILSENKVVFKNDVKDWKEAINILGNILQKNGSINNKYTQSMIDNIENLGPYIIIDDNIALPHSQSLGNVYKTDISLLILKEAVDIKGRMAKIFFCFSTSDEKNHLEILNDIYKLILRPNFIKEMGNIDNYQKLVEYIDNYREE
jgi:transcriptional antiterminator, bglG